MDKKKKKRISKKKMTDKAYIADITSKVLVIEERLELLESLKLDVDSGEGIPDIKLGGLVDDLGILNPLTTVDTINFLLPLYNVELASYRALLANQN